MGKEHLGMGLIARMVITRIDRTTAGCGSWIPKDEVEWHGLSLIKDERTPQDAVRNSFKMKRDSQDGYQSG